MSVALTALLGLALTAPLSSPALAAPAAAGAEAAGASEFQPYGLALAAHPYPHEVRSFSLQARGQTLEMAYMDVAPEGDPRGTVLLLHGKNFSGAYWADTIASLTERGYRVIAPDQVGFGRSSKPLDLQYSFHALADWTGALLDDLGVDQATVVGHSMGGMLATRFALMFPARSAGLVLVNPIGLEDWSRKTPYRSVDAWTARNLKSSPQGVRDYMAGAYFDGQWKPEWDAIAAIQAGWSIGPDKEHVARVSALHFDMIYTQPVIHDFEALTVPTLLIIGERDRTALNKDLVPAEVALTLGRYEVLGEQAAAAIPDATLVELPGIGHMPQVEAFDRYEAALTRFVTEQWD